MRGRTGRATRWSWSVCGGGASCSGSARRARVHLSGGGFGSWEEMEMGRDNEDGKRERSDEEGCAPKGQSKTEGATTHCRL